MTYAPVLAQLLGLQREIAGVFPRVNNPSATTTQHQSLAIAWKPAHHCHKNRRHSIAHVIATLHAVLRTLGLSRHSSNASRRQSTACESCFSIKATTYEVGPHLIILLISSCLLTSSVESRSTMTGKRKQSAFSRGRPSMTCK